MQPLTEVLDHEIHTLERVLLHVTTVRLLLAAGKHQLVPHGLEELDGSVARFEAAAVEAQRFLQATGHSSFSDAATGLPLEDRVDVEHRLATVNALHRDVRVALSSTGATAERAVRTAAEHLPDGAAQVPQATRRHPFMTGV